MYFDNIITIYMATKKQKIRKRKTFRGGMKERSKPTSKSKSQSPYQMHGFQSSSNVLDLIRDIKNKKRNGNGSIRSITRSQENKSLKNWTKSTNKRQARFDLALKTKNHELYELRHGSKRLPTVQERVAQEDAEEDEPELLPPVTRTVFKPTNYTGLKAIEKDHYEKLIEQTNEQIRITETRIMELKKQRTEQENSLRSIQSQSFLRSQLSRFTGAPTSENINREIFTINQNIKKLEDELLGLNTSLIDYKRFLSQSLSKQMKN